MDRLSEILQGIQHKHKHKLCMIHFICIKHYKLRGNVFSRGHLRLMPSLKHSVPYSWKYLRFEAVWP